MLQMVQTALHVSTSASADDVSIHDVAYYIHLWNTLMFPCEPDYWQKVFIFRGNL